MAKQPEAVSIRLNAFLFNSSSTSFETFLQSPYRTAKSYDVATAWGFEGKIFVKDPKGGRPRWATQLDKLHASPLPDLETLSASAVLFVRAPNRTVAFVFGYGRYLLDDAEMISDFGIKTALNTLNNTTLRSVDLYSLEQEPMQKRTQAMRASNVNSFDIDVSRDILKAVTGEPNSGISWQTIHGAGAQYSLTVSLQDLSELPKIAAKLSSCFDQNTYKNGFEWVDNIQRVRNETFIDTLDGLLLTALKGAALPDLQLTLPHLADWDKVAGFSFTNAKTKVKPILSAADYFAENSPAGHTLEKLKSNRVFCFDVDDNESSYSVYSCIYYECAHQGKLYILFAKDWFSVDQAFMSRIDASMKSVPVSTLTFPVVETSPSAATKGQKGTKPAKIKIVLEAEGEYNTRVSGRLGYHLLDRKLVKPRTGASPIELCDLLTDNQEFIHAKHRKGGSAGLSHLFAQGRIAAELLLSDQEFRRDARTKLSHGAKHLIEVTKFDPSKCEIVFLVLGDTPATVKENLPFFSKVNLWLTYVNLVQRNFRVSITAAPLAPSVPPAAKPILVAPRPASVGSLPLTSSIATRP